LKKAPGAEKPQEPVSTNTQSLYQVTELAKS